MASWEAKRAGDTSYNVVYIEIGTYNGKALYQYYDATYPRFLYWSTGNYWALGPADPNISEIDEYYSAGANLPGNPWTELGGMSPGPIVVPAGKDSKKLTMTNVAADCGAVVACSGADAATITHAIESSLDATPGILELTVVLAEGQTNVRGVHYQSKLGEPGEIAWPSGQWTIELNVTNSDADIIWTGVYICRVNSSCVSQATVGSLTGQSISLGTTGFKVMSVDGAGQTAATNDYIYVVLTFTNEGAGSQDFGFTPNGYLYLPPGWPEIVYASYNSDMICKNYGITWGADRNSTFEDLVFTGNVDTNQTEVTLDYDPTYGDIIISKD